MNIYVFVIIGRTNWVRVYLGGGITGLGTCVFGRRLGTCVFGRRDMWIGYMCIWKEGIGYMCICVYKEEGYVDWVHNVCRNELST